ncbi:MAG: hypothetical protein F7O42_10115 [Opitutae bacterium]|nr:hypothetical protein [Opitutae bacterium]
MHEDDNSPSEEEEYPFSKPQERSGTGIKLTFEAAEDVVRRSRRELQAPPGTSRADKRSRLARINLHDENVLIGYDGRLYFIDTCIYVKEGEWGMEHGWTG